MALPTEYQYSGVVLTPPDGTTILTLTTSEGREIPYADPDHIHVYTSNDNFESFAELVRPDAWDFTFYESRLIELVEPAVGQQYLLRRETPLEALMQFSDGALLNADELEQLRKINLYRDQESYDADLQLRELIEDVAEGIDPFPPPEPPDEILPDQANQMLLQLGGNPVVGPTSSNTVDPLNAMYVLYVDPVRGQDDFVTGSYAAFDDGSFDSKMLRMENQRLKCGYTEAAPFKTINRAVIEAAIITSKSWMTFGGNTCGDLVSIQLMPGVHEVLNGPGTGSGTVWQDGKVPTAEELRHFNATNGGIILPRGCSLFGLDLRKVNIRPDLIPASLPREADWSNQQGIFRSTGGGYYFGMTFLDGENVTTSHHLLSAFKNCSTAELDEFYSKILAAFGPPENTGNLRVEIVRSRPSEYQIVGPVPVSGDQGKDTDTVQSASPYIFNCSLRSRYGMGGMVNDGSLTDGLDSMVVAQFTGVSLQTDLTVWDRYDPNNDVWDTGGTAFATYAEYVSNDPNGVRFRKGFESYHVVALNDAFIQEVSVFAIGQAYHHYSIAGGEITITNSNSTFGGCAAFADGYKNRAEPTDQGWGVGRLKVPYNLAVTTGNIEVVQLGVVESLSGSEVTLLLAPEPSRDDPNTPEILTSRGYSFVEDSLLWIENTRGLDWSAPCSAITWDANDASGGKTLTCKVNFTDENGDGVGFKNDGVTSAAIDGRVYLRRLVDVRPTDERRCSLVVANTDPGSRAVPRDYALQCPVTGTLITAPIPVDQTLVATTSAPAQLSESLGAFRQQEITIRRASKPSADHDWVSGAYYRAGDKVRNRNLHWACVQTNDDATFEEEKWSKTHVFLNEGEVIEDFFENEAPIIIFDDDTDKSSSSLTLGWDLGPGGAWISDSRIVDQYFTGSDVAGMLQFLEVLGFTESEAKELLQPRARDERERDPTSDSDMLGYSPTTGIASDNGNWPVEFRRPSIIRLFGHAWEWAGFLNYTKALPDYQRSLSEQNLFSYYFSVARGGRVYGSGFNEQGFQVTQSGLVDLSTGKRRTVANLGAIDVSIDEQTRFVNAILENTQFLGRVDFSKIQNFIWGDAAFSDEITAGVVELADNDEVRENFLDPLTVLPDSESGARRVVPVESLRGLKEAILSEVRLLEARFRYVYIHKDINRTSASQPADVTDGNPENPLFDPTTVPDVIWTDIKRHRQVHEITSTPWIGTQPSRSNDQEVFELASVVCFPTVNMATEWLDSRTVVDNSSISVFIYEPGDSTNTVEYKGAGEIVFEKGPAQPPSTVPDSTLGKAPPIYMNGKVFRFGVNTVVGFSRVILNMNGTAANPTKSDRNVGWPILFETSTFVGGPSSISFFNVDLIYRVTKNDWIRLVQCAAINIHEIRGTNQTDFPDTRRISKCNFVMQQTNSSGDTNGQGLIQALFGGNVRISNQRGIGSEPSDREIIFDVLQDPVNTRQIDLLTALDATISFGHQQNSNINSRNYTGGWYRINVNAGGADRFRFCANGGISSETQGCAFRFIQSPIRVINPDNSLGDPAIDNPLYDAMFDIAITRSDGSNWTSFRAFDMGTGFYANFGLAFGDVNGFWRKCCRALVAGSVGGNLLDRSNPDISALLMKGGANINGDLRINRAYYPLDTTTLEEIVYDATNPVAAAMADEGLEAGPIEVDGEGNVTYDEVVPAPPTQNP